MSSAPPPCGPSSQAKEQRAQSFGTIASHYERFRPGPPMESVDWLVPTHVGTVVDLGAGTGALTRLLVARANEVVAVEPDERMRAVLTEQVPDATTVNGRAESIPLPSGSADAVLASSSWHWVDPVPALTEVARVLVPGGVLGAIWSGPDPEGPFMSQARALLAGQTSDGDDHEAADEGDDAPAPSDLGNLIMGDSMRPEFVLTIPAGMPFDTPKQRVFRWDVPLNADELIGLLGTLSWIITMPAGQRERVVTQARLFLRDLLGVEGEVNVDVAFRADVWRSRRTD